MLRLSMKRIVPLQISLHLTILVFLFLAILSSVVFVRPKVVSAEDSDSILIELINNERHQVGLSNLVVSTLLHQAAVRHNQVMNECAAQVSTEACFSHQVTSKNEVSVWDRLVQIGYNPMYSSENIGWGYVTPQEVVAGWMNSSGHKANILNAQAENIGCSFIDGNNGDYKRRFYTCDFGKSTSTQVTPTPAIVRKLPIVTETPILPKPTVLGMQIARASSSNTPSLPPKQMPAISPAATVSYTPLASVVVSAPPVVLEITRHSKHWWCNYLHWLPGCY